MKYICLGYYDRAKFEALSEGEREAMFDACFTYDDYLRESGHWAGGEGLEPTALTVRGKQGKVTTTDGPFAETREQLGGILILEARDLNHAAQLIGQHPAMQYDNIFEIRPVGDMSAITEASAKRRRKIKH